VLTEDRVSTERSPFRGQHSSMSAAQLMIGTISVVASIATFVLMRFPQHRREQYRGEPFSVVASLIAAAAVLAVGVIFVVAQGRFESR
jgi:hypothetical protein